MFIKQLLHFRINVKFFIVLSKIAVKFLFGNLTDATNHYA